MDECGFVFLIKENLDKADKKRLNLKLKTEER